MHNIELTFLLENVYVLCIIPKTFQWWKVDRWNSQIWPHRSFHWTMSPSSIASNIQSRYQSITFWWCGSGRIICLWYISSGSGECEWQILYETRARRERKVKMNQQNTYYTAATLCRVVDAAQHIQQRYIICI